MSLPSNTFKLIYLGGEDQARPSAIIGGNDDDN